MIIEQNCDAQKNKNGFLLIEQETQNHQNFRQTISMHFFPVHKPMNSQIHL